MPFCLMRNPPFRFSAPLLGALCVMSLPGWLGPLSLRADDPVPVEVVTAQLSGEVDRTVSLTGTVTSHRKARLSARTDGLVLKLGVDAGSVVGVGDELMMLDPRLAEIELDLIRAEMEAAAEQLADAKRRVGEVRDLVETGGFAKSQAETLESALRIREAELKRFRVREVEQRERIERHRLVAPFAGVIARRYSEVGEWVDTGTPVLELVETARVWFDLQVPQELLAPVRGAKKVTVVLDAYPDRLIDAEIAVVVPVKDEVSRTFLTRLNLDAPEGLASPGMSGAAVITWQSANTSSVRVPRDAVVRFPDGSAKVWVVGDGSAGGAVVKPHDIRTAGILGELVEVVEGLQGGERVVVRGNEGLREGQSVSLREGKTSVNESRGGMAAP